MSHQITSPEAFFGFRMGTDRKIARWNRIVEYFELLATESDCIKVTNMGPSTEGNPFLLVTISSAANLERLDHYRELNLKLSDPRGVTPAEVEAMVEEGKVFICQSMSLHATEIGGTQMAPELAHDLLASDCEDTRRVLDNVVFLMVPCFNPDGQIMVTDWYNEWLGTEYEGCNYPKLYQKYTGHDNNRDALTQNMVESRYMGEILLRKWRPQAYLDHHHQGSDAARFNIPPYSDPIHPHGDPLVWQEINWYGAHMATLLETAGKQGVLHSARYEGWGHLGYHWITVYHNIAGMLTESASAKLATPLYIQPEQLAGASPKTMPKYEAQVNFPNPWPGGWWRLRDIVEQKKIAAWALLDIAARCRPMVLRNAYLKAVRQTERGEADQLTAYLIPADQHDTLTAGKLIRALHDQGLEVQVAAAPFAVGRTTYPAGTHAVLLAQPKMGLVKTLLGRTHYPDGYWTRDPQGNPMVRDMTTDTIAEFMGVEVVPVAGKLHGEFSVTTQVPQVAASVSIGEGGTVFDGRLNDSYRVANRLLASGVRVWRATGTVETGNCCALPPGAFYIAARSVDDATLKGISAETGVAFIGVSGAPAQLTEVTRRRVGLYQRYWTGNIDEGWTRFLLEQYEFDCQTLTDADLVAGDLAAKIDVLILPSDSREMMLGPVDHPPKDPRLAGQVKRFGKCPPDYQSGFGIEGVKAIGEFATAGGRVVALDAAYKLVVEACGLGVRSVTEGLSSKQYLTKGSTLHVLVDNTDPLGYGMPERALIQSVDSPVFETTETFDAEDLRSIVTFPERDILRSGWLIGEELLRGRPALVRAKVGQGDVVLIGFRCQHRAQTHGTFKFLFNALV